MKIQKMSIGANFGFDTIADEKYIRVICGDHYYDLKDDHEGNLVINTGINRAVVNNASGTSGRLKQALDELKASDPVLIER